MIKDRTRQATEMQQGTIPPRRSSSFTNTTISLVPSGSIHWEPLRQRLVSSADLSDSLAAAQELRSGLDTVPKSEYPLLLSALLPAVSTVLVTKTRPVAVTNSIEYQLRQALLDFLNKLVTTVPSSHHSSEDVLRQHAPHLVAVAMDVLTRDFEDHAVSASRMLFDLYKTYQTLPTDSVQPYLDFVTALYRHLPLAMQRNFHPTALAAVPLTPKLPVPPAVDASTNPINADTTVGAATLGASETEKPGTADNVPMEIDTPSEPKSQGTATQSTTVDRTPGPSSSLSVASASSTLSLSTLQTDAHSPTQRVLLPSNVSFRVLTECPLVVMLMFQLYPQFMKTNIPVLVKVMMDSLSQRPPSLQSIAASMISVASPRPPVDSDKKKPVKIDSAVSRVYFSRLRELVAAQAKTLSFLTYLLRTFSAELKPYEDALASNVVALMTHCPRESIGTRKELLVATRHLLNSDFRAGFFRHIDPMLDERLLMGTTMHSGSSSNRTDPTLIRPLAYTTLSDFVQHVRTLLSMKQMSRVVCLFSRILHDTSKTLPLGTQFTAVRTLLSVVDLIFHNNDPDGQIGRDMLVRILDTLVDKLQALTDYLPDVLMAERKRESMDQALGSPQHDGMSSSMDMSDDRTTSPAASAVAWLLLHHQNSNSNHPPDLVRDTKSMIRAIIVGQKTLIFYISSYRSQRMELLLKGVGDVSSSHSVSSNRDMQAVTIPPGSNEEVATAMLKITNTEIAIIDRYIVTAISAMKLLAESADTTVLNNHLATSSAGVPTNRKSTNSTEKVLSEQHRDALTYFAAAFTGLDGYNLRRSLGRRLDLLIDAIVDDPMVMIIPRHLLGSNATTSLEFCSILLDWLVERMDLLGHHPTSSLLFVDQQPSGHHDVSERQYIREQLHSITQRPLESIERLKQRSTTMLQLFERVLKSLSVHPDNEVVVRRHLRRIVVVCLRSSMENVNGWPENYCMLVRFVFRAISAGKFEDSYRALLPLIPTVLNGLYRVVCSTDGDSALRSTAIELCLTIPARLSSLLPHMNLLLRIIIPALDSKSGDLVNLGLRTLEFWVDNLNPLFLYPEISKQTELFSTLMQALSSHLRPAPYPYGLLTLRLLGKLGGKNRLFLRDAMKLCEPQPMSGKSGPRVECWWRKNADAMDDADSSTISIVLPLGACVDTLRMIAMEPCVDDNEQGAPENPDARIHRKCISRLWDCKVEDLDAAMYAKDVINAAKNDQANASLNIILAAIPQVAEGHKVDLSGSVARSSRDGRYVCIGLLYALMIDDTRDAASVALSELVTQLDASTIADSLSEFLAEPSSLSTVVGLEFLGVLLGSAASSIDANSTLYDELVRSLCEVSCSYSWDRQIGPQEAVCKLAATLGSEWSRKHEVKLINAAIRPVKTIPRELSEAAIDALRSFIMICNTLYGTKWSFDTGDEAMVWDMLSSMDGTLEKEVAQRVQSVERYYPSEEVFKITIHELTSPQHLTRFAARFLLNFFAFDSTTENTNGDIALKHFDFIRRVLFSRSLRLLPLPHQVGVVEGLTATIKQFPTLLPLTDQHLVACLSDLLKMASVADKEMTDDKLSNVVVDKDGYVPSEVIVDSSQYPTHASALFFRRTCILDVFGAKVVIPGELPAGVQLRVSTIVLLHAIIRTNTDPFFDAETTTPIGNIRPHVISLLFRSLVSSPIKAVNASHSALRDALSLSRSPRSEEEDEAASSQSRLPKELLQTCIRPVLQNLREHTRLSVPLLRGLSRLLSLLSSWFNKTLGEKLLDHLRKWGDPSRIISHKIWREGEEPLVAASIVSIFVSLPHASQFVEVLVKTCIKLESTLSSFKFKFVDSPYRRPLGQYLNKHAQHAVNFFFPRLKTPLYSELFHYIVQLEDSVALREYLCNKQCSVMLLNVCFERPLAIIKIEKSSTPGAAKTSLALYGIGSLAVDPSADLGATSQRPMTIETLEMQHQGFRLVSTLLANKPAYFQDHSDVVRAFRWLWRSKGRSLRLQHEEMLPPRFHDESKMLAFFLMHYVKSSSSDDLDILFELFRVFLQPSTSDFAFVSRFLVRMVTNVLSLEQKRKVMQRFYASIAGDTNEDIKVLGIQFLIFPMVAADCRRHKSGAADQANLMDDGVVEKFVNDIIFHEGVPVIFGDRLKVELLRLLYLFVEYSTSQIEPFRAELVKYCWGLLKSEDTQCKCWAYVVVCRLITAFETPAKIVRQVYTSLLRFHQHENKELVRAALDLLVPVLPTRLSDREFLHFVEQAASAMTEEGSSISNLAHVGQIVVRFPDIFKRHSTRFVPLLVNSLSRLGLTTNGPSENRLLSVSIAELLLCWDRSNDAEMDCLLPDHAGILCNFLIRIQLLLEAGSPLAPKSLELLKVVLEKWRPAVSASPLEKCMSKTAQVPANASAVNTHQVLACLQLISALAEFRYFTFLSRHAALAKSIIERATEHAREEPLLLDELRIFVPLAKNANFVSAFLLTSLEKALEDEIYEQKRPTSSDRSSDRSRTTKDRPGDEAPIVSLHALRVLELISDVCRGNVGNLNAVLSALLALARQLCKAHLSDTAAKQRQGSTNAPRAASSGIRYHTPTMGILDEAHMRYQSSTSKLTKARGKEEIPLSPPIRSLILILSMLETSDVIFTFTPNRKSLLLIIVSILENSDSVQLLMIAMRCVGKWVLSCGPSVPLSVKEKNSLMLRIASYDLSNVADDVTAQPLADLASDMVVRFSSHRMDDESRRLAGACLLHPDLSVREAVQTILVSSRASDADYEESSPVWASNLLFQALHTDFEGLCARFWIVGFVDYLMQPLVTQGTSKVIESIRVLAHGSISTCLQMLEALLPRAWSEIPDDSIRIRLIASIEALLAKTYHAQLLRARSELAVSQCLNSVRSFLNIILLMSPIPVLDTHLLVALAENYNCWYEVVALLEKRFQVLRSEHSMETTLSAMRHCYRQLGEEDVWRCLARQSCVLAKSKMAISFETYEASEEAANAYAELMSETESGDLDPTDFEMDVWEERWVLLQKELCQFEVVSEFAMASASASLQLECAWKSQDWSRVRALCASTTLLAAVENGDPLLKLSETLLAVADGKLSEVENLHAQTAQLCLYKWQLLPRLSSGSLSHASLLHFFHRLVEIRESGQIMVETSNHSNGRTLPDLKNLLSAWRYRLPNDWESLTMWDEIFAWRAHMFSAITTNFHWCDPDTLAAQHDRPWTALRFAKTARKQGMPDVARLLLSKATEEQTMNVSDAYTKLREQILTYFNPESKLERTGGLSLIDATNLSFFDASQTSELFRLKAVFLQSLQSRSKANQAYCHAVQICPTHARAWDSWGELCASLGAVTEKQREQASGSGGETGKDFSQKVRQYLAQAMGCYIEAIQIDAHEWARIRIPKCLWMLAKDGAVPGVLCQTLETRGAYLPAWVWLPWVPQLLTSFYRREGQAIKSIFTRLVKTYPQAVYYPLRAFYLERRDVDRVKSSSASTSSSNQQSSVARAEELMSLLRRSHASLWSSLETCLEELIVTFRPSYEEELLATIVVLLERAESQVGNNDRKDDVWKTLGKIAVKFFRRSNEPNLTTRDARMEKTAQFKEAYKEKFEFDFQVSSNEVNPGSSPDAKSPLDLDDIVAKLCAWKVTLENHVLTFPESMSLIEASHSLAMFGVGDSPDLWPGSCDPSITGLKLGEREITFDTDTGNAHTSTSSSALAARKAAKSATKSATEAAMREGVSGEYGGGSSWIEIPGQYCMDVRPSPELHAKLVKFEPFVRILRRSDTLVRRIGMVANDGKTYHFLLQFAVPYLTRTDERNSQVHYILDKVLRKVARSSRAALSIQSYPVIPVAQRLRLVSEPDGRKSLEGVHREVCLQRNVDPCDLPKRFNDEVKNILNEKRHEEMTEEESLELGKTTRLDVFTKISSLDGVDDMIMTDYLFSLLQGPEPLYQFRNMFARQWAANCLLQFVLSSSERTPAKVVFDYCSGRVLAPEFRIGYTNQGCFESQPTPFRLTPNLATMIGFPLLDARFMTTMGIIAGAVQACHQDLDPVFRLLMRDDLVAFYTKSAAKSDAKTAEMEKQLSSSVSRNAATIHMRFAECAPLTSMASETSNEFKLADYRVRELVEAAQSAENLCMMSGNFHGWL